MILLGLDSTYNVIVSAAQFDGDNVSSIGIGVTGISRIDGNSSQSATFESDTFISMLASKGLTLKQFFNAADRYCIKDSTLFFRPTWVISVTSDSTIASDRAFVVPVNTDVTVRVTYTDPDALDFLKTGLTISVSDKADFITLPATVTNVAIDEQNQYLEFTVKSAFPGICRLKAKDTQKLCLGLPTSIRFKQ